MSFWTSEDKIPVEQKKVSIPAENGLNYNPGQKIEFKIPAGIDFFQPKESYLKFNVKVAMDTAAAPTKLMLDPILGGQVLIKDVRVYSGGAGRILLEEYQNYNTLVAAKYDYETNDSLKAKRGLTEGAINYSAKTRSTLGVNQDCCNNLESNPYFAEETGTLANALVNASFQKVSCLLPLHTGIFTNDKIFPIGMTDGLHIEIILESADKCVKQMDTVNEYRKLWANPLFHSTNGSHVAPDYPFAANASAFTEFYIRRDNMTGVNASVSTQNFPFAVGETFRFVNGSTGQVVESQANGSLIATIEQIEYTAGLFNMVKVTVAGGTGFRPSHALTKDNFMVSTSVSTSVADYRPSYEITDCEFICQQVTMPPGYTNKLSSMMKSGGAMNYDFQSATNYKISQIASERVATLRLPLNESRAKAVLCIPTNASVLTSRDYITGKNQYVDDMCRDAAVTSTWMNNQSNRHGIVGIADELTQYQLFYDGRLNPNRKVQCGKTSSKVSIDAQPLIELEKALVMAGMTPHSLMNFRKNFIIGRALSLQNGVYDARGKDFQLQVEYQNTAAPSFNKLWMCYCSHLRRIVIKGDSIQLQI